MIFSPKGMIKTGLDAALLMAGQNRDALKLIRTQTSARDLSPRTPTEQDLRRVIDWIKRAQDSSSTGGVAWGFRARQRIRSSHEVGWEGAYPETTGYIIETMIRFGRIYNDSDSVTRALRMADWECSIQLSDGGIQGGIYHQGETGAPSTFVTGQVIFGWLAAYRHTHEEKYLRAARRAGDWLLSCLDDQGRFVKGYSLFCAPGPKAYEARTAWALALVGSTTGDKKYIDAAHNICSFSARCQTPNGWFEQNDLNEHDKPLTHTIGYVLEGMMETAMVTKDGSWVTPVLTTLDRLLTLIAPNGFLAGRWYRDWKPAVDWACLTGSSQIAGVYLRMHHRLNIPIFEVAAQKLLGFVTATQLQHGYHPGLVGAIHGSYPFSGDYGRECVLNWAGKFFADSVLDFLNPNSSDTRD